MSRLFRSKSTGIARFPDFDPKRPGFHSEEGDGEEEIEKDDEYEEGESTTSDGDDSNRNPISTPFIGPGARAGRNPFPILGILVAVLRKSLVTCGVERDNVATMDISWPTEVRHVSHVTFDRFNGFLGVPSELEPEVPRQAPSASASVFGVSAKSMQCSYDTRGNSVPTILLMMQKRLYVEKGLRAEGIFRINPDNGQEVYVRQQLNRGTVPQGIDVHCLAGLIKAWFRELPTGVLDLLTPEQVMQCNTEDDCNRLVTLLPPTESALLNWAINLMADVVEQKRYNKMNARNIAMVFAPNMTQMADPLTALVHAVQVMNFLKNLILKNLRERDQPALDAKSLSSSPTSPVETKNPDSSIVSKKPNNRKFLRTATLCRLEADNSEKFWNFRKKTEDGNNGFDHNGVLSVTGEYDNGDRLSLRRGVRRLCRHPVFQFTKPAKKIRDLGVVNTDG